MSNPKRHGFKNKHKLVKRYRSEFWLNFLIGGALSYPLAVAVGKRMSVSQGGVVAAPLNRWVHNWPIVDPNYTAQKYFKRWRFATMMFCGWAFGRYMTDDSILSNRWYSRPDFKPKMAMVDLQDQTDYDPVAYEQVMDSMYGKYKQEHKKSALYRLLWPDFADWQPKTNLWVGRHPSTNFNPKTGEFPLSGSDYADHQY